MKNVFIEAISFLLFLLSAVYAQNETVMPVLVRDDLSGLKIQRTEYYDGNSLWGLINGGADIYLEYGFDKMLLQTVELNRKKYRIEIYRMKDEKSAFGIYSVYRHKCDSTTLLTKYNCINPYQVQAARGRYYFSISNESGTYDAMLITLRMFVLLLGKTDETDFEIPGFFNRYQLSGEINKLKLIKGQLGIQNGFPMWTEKFEGFENFSLFVLPLTKEEKFAYVALITFNDENDMQKFLDRNSENELILSKASGNNDLIFIETNFEGGDKESLKSLVME